jgi:hypothetical protein
MKMYNPVYEVDLFLVIDEVHALVSENGASVIYKERKI